MNNNLNVQIYSSCNCKCSFCNFTDSCYNKINPQFVLDYIKNNPNITYILLTGGEPTFAIEEYKQIIQGLEDFEGKVTLQTNGWWGNNDKIKDIIKNYPPITVHVSVDYEKQKHIPLDTVKEAVKFLQDNNITVTVVNHTEDEDEHNFYKQHFTNLKQGYIIVDNNIDLHDCGEALLATNKIGRLNIKGWN